MRRLRLIAPFVILILVAAACSDDGGDDGDGGGGGGGGGGTTGSEDTGTVNVLNAMEPAEAEAIQPIVEAGLGAAP